jgi:predicted Ser/Thr protein kinase
MNRRIGRYEVLETLGKGGMGVVYRAKDPELGRDVAIKVVLSWAQYDEDAMARFNREARVVAQLQHPHIVTVYDAGRTEDGLPYFVMEYIEGTDLGEILGMVDSLAPARALRYVLQLCGGLAYAHARDIVHRDIKPANLLVTSQDNVRIVDFGIAKLVGTQMTGTGVSLGTPLYMAPEQVAGKPVDHRADIFAVGGVLYTLLAGCSPFDAPSLGAICNKIETKSPPSLSKMGADVPARLEKIILRALEKNPEKRYQSVEQLAEDLRGVQVELRAEDTSPTLVETKSTTALRRTRAERVERHRPHRAVTLAILGVAAAVALWAAPTSSLDYVMGLLKAPGEEASPAGESTAGESTTAEPTAAEAAGATSETSESEPQPAPSGGAAAATGTQESEPRSAAATRPQEVRDEAAVREEPPALQPASAAEQAAVNRLVGELIRGIQRKDSLAIARVFGGSIPETQWRGLGRMLSGPRMRIRHQVGDVLKSEDGMVVAEVQNNILFGLDSSGRVPAPRQITWTLRFRSDRSGLHLASIRQR